MIKSPYADPMKPSYSVAPPPEKVYSTMPVGQIKMNAPEPIPVLSGPMPAPEIQVDRGPMPSPGIGGAFEAQFDQAGPLSSYQSYLMQTYGAPAMDNAQQFIQDDVNYFVDLVNQAERAHFGQGSAQPQAQTPMDRGIASLPAAF